MTKQQEWLRFRKKFMADKQNHEGYWVCEHCKLWITNPEVDHIIKRSLRPDLVFDPTNLQVLCPPCHRNKHNSIDSAFAQA